MASSGETELRVPIGIPVETNASEAADAVEALRDKIASSKDAIKEASGALRNLRGNTDEIKAAKDQLKATLDKERAALSDATLKMIKHGSSTQKVAADTKKMAAASSSAAKAQGDAVSKSLASTGGAIGAVRDKLKSLKEMSGDAGLNLLSLAAAGAAAALAALAAAAVAGGFALAKWIIKGADAARSMALFREAAAGSKQGTIDLGIHIDQLAGKVPQSTQALNELATSLRKSGLGGQTLIDTLNGVAQANAALGDDAGAKLREIVTRGRLLGTMGINPLELQGTGLMFQDVAASLAKSMNVSVAKATEALANGRVKLADGAKAIRDAMEAKLGDINLRKMYSLENIGETLHKKFAKLTSGINLDRLVKPLAKFFDIFDADATATGAALKRIVTVIGDGIGGAFERAIPLAQKFVRGAIVGGLKLYIGWLKVKKAFAEAFGDKSALSNVDAVGAALSVASFWLENGVRAFYGMAAAVGVAVAAFALVKMGVEQLAAPFMALVKLIDGIDWPATGRAVVDGIVKGISGSARQLVDTVKGLGDMVKGAFTGKLEIHSPSKVFEKYGRALPDGAVKGVDGGAPALGSAVAEMAPSPPSARGKLGNTTVSINMPITYVAGGKGGGDVDAGFIEQVRAGLRKVLLEELAAAGIGVTA